MEVSVETAYYIILVPMVYVAFFVFFIGTAFRLVKMLQAPKHPTTTPDISRETTKVAVGAAGYISSANGAKTQPAAVGVPYAVPYLFPFAHHRTY